MLRVFEIGLVLLLIGGLSASATAQMFGNRGLDPGFCRTKAVRQTVIYIDDMLMIDGQTNWTKVLVEKLKASLAPGEPVTVVRLSPATGTCSEIWHGCWPQFTNVQKEEIKKGEPYLLKKNPLDTIEEQQGFFVRDIVAAFSKIYFEAKRDANSARFTADKAPKKEIVRGLASDEGRFANSQMTIRAIMYSDMAENSNIGSAAGSQPEQVSTNAGKINAHLRKSVFYVFGVGEDVIGVNSMRENAKNFWIKTLGAMTATLGGFGSDLNVPVGIPVQSYVYQTTLKRGDQEVDGKLALLVDNDGNLVDSWIGFNRLSVTFLTGTFFHGANGYKLDAMTASGLTTDSPAETVNLDGKSDQLEGMLGVKGTKMMYPVVAHLEGK
jgi:hypothetical protein